MPSGQVKACLAALLTPAANSHTLNAVNSGKKHFFCPCYVICFFCVVLQRQRLIQARGGHEGGGPAGEEGLGVSGPWGRENGTVNEGDRQMLESERELSKEISGEARGAAVSKEEEEEEQDEGEDHNSPFNPFSLPGEQTISCCTYS